MGSVAHPQVPINRAPTIDNKAHGIPTPSSSPPEQDYGDVHLADPMLAYITADESTLPPASTLPRHQRGLLSNVLPSVQIHQIHDISGRVLLRGCQNGPL